jgi:hypothetical protein
MRTLSGGVVFYPATEFLDSAAGTGQRNFELYHAATHQYLDGALLA